VGQQEKTDAVPWHPFNSRRGSEPTVFAGYYICEKTFWTTVKTCYSRAGPPGPFAFYQDLGLRVHTRRIQFYAGQCHTWSLKFRVTKAESTRFRPAVFKTVRLRDHCSNHVCVIRIFIPINLFCITFTFCCTVSSLLNSHDVILYIVKIKHLCNKVSFINYCVMHPFIIIII